MVVLIYRRRDCVCILVIHFSQILYVGKLCLMWYNSDGNFGQDRLRAGFYVLLDWCRTTVCIAFVCDIS